MAVSSWNDNGQKQFVADPGMPSGSPSPRGKREEPSRLNSQQLTACHYRTLCHSGNVKGPHPCRIQGMSLVVCWGPVFVVQRRCTAPTSSLASGGCCGASCGRSSPRSGPKHILSATPRALLVAPACPLGAPFSV